MTQEENEKLMYASDEDIAFYHKCVEGLPTLAGLDGSGNGSDGIPLPYGCGSHSVRCLREIIQIVKPKRMLEIGMNMAWSSAMWLELSPKLFLLTCDISEKKETITAAEIMKDRYEDRFVYLHRDYLNEYLFGNFDLCFIDGGHLIDDVTNDINLCLELGIKYIAFDDYLPEFGQVQEAIAKFGNKLEQINVNGNIALYRNTNFL